MLTLNLTPAAASVRAGEREVLMITNADLREPANLTCWPMQQRFERKLQTALEKTGWHMKRAHDVDNACGHGFISSQKEGSALFAHIDADAPLIVLLTAWQYSHHIAPSLVHHRGPLLLLANFDGTFPGLVGMLCMAGTLTSLGKTCPDCGRRISMTPSLSRGWPRGCAMAHCTMQPTICAPLLPPTP
ncbi:hypothetical protein SODG_003411 [Sodalis praecaptivus]